MNTDRRPTAAALSSAAAVQAADSWRTLEETQSLSFRRRSEHHYEGTVATVHGIVEAFSVYDPAVSAGHSFVRFVHRGRIYLRTWPVAFTSQWQGTRLAKAFAQDVMVGHVDRWRGGRSYRPRQAAPAS